MSLFFDVDWFDARLAARGLDRAALAEAAGIDCSELHGLFTNARAPNADELSAFARLLEVDLVEVSLRSGVAARDSDPNAEPSARIESIEARLDAIDAWIAELEALKKKRA